MTRSFAVRALVLASSLVALSCATNLRVDPEGYRCDPGGVCPSGYACVNDVCRKQGGACDQVVCNQPPAATCEGNTARTYSGTCEASTGQCVYAPIDTPCAAGCQAGACVDPCAGVSCVTPPAPSCADANTLRTFAQTGTCTNGQCSYQPTDTNCPNGCSAGVCQGADLCAGKTCDTPPPPTCVGSSQRTFAAMGACQASTGQCQYAPTDVVCPAGCVQGACVVPPLTFAQVGPRVRFPISAIDVAPNSSGNSVLAVGQGGRMARWNGMAWAEVVTPTSNNLNRVAFVTGGVAYVVGDNKTVLTYRPASGQLLSATVPGSGSARLVGLSGRAENDVLVSDDVGGFWRLTGGGWSNGTLPSTNGPYQMKAAYLDEAGRERIVGSCGSSGSSCVAYRTSSTGSWRVDTRFDTLGYDAVGGSFDPATSGASEALLGQSDNDVVSHGNAGAFSSLSISPLLDGTGVVGVTAQALSVTRQVYVLTSSATDVGHLFRLTRVGASSFTSTVALDTYQGEEVLSPNEATGVIVAEVNRAGRANNIFRRSIVVDQALDIGEDLVGVSTDGVGTLVLASIYGDVATLGAGSATFDFRRATAALSIKAVEARRGTGILLVGSVLNGTTGEVYRVLPASGFSELGSTPNVTWNAVCRVSDTEGWVVGTGGAIASVTATGVTTVTSPTTKDLLAVDCAAGFAVATGADGTVLVRSGGAWALAPGLSALSGKALTAVALVNRTAFVGGDGVFAKLDMSGTWTTLPSRTGLRSLIARGASDVYGTVLNGTRSDVVRFDGTSWGNSLLQVTAVLGGGVQVGGKVVWGGSGGAVVEGR